MTGSGSETERRFENVSSYSHHCVVGLFTVCFEAGDVCSSFFIFNFNKISHKM